MTTQNYLIIQENIVTNVCLWDGDVNTWQPPQDATILVKDTTSTIVWKLNTEKTGYVLTNSIGDADIGFTWDGTVATTNQPQPEVPVQPNSSGTQTL